MIASKLTLFGIFNFDFLPQAKICSVRGSEPALANDAPLLLSSVPLSRHCEPARSLESMKMRAASLGAGGNGLLISAMLIFESLPSESLQKLKIPAGMVTPTPSAIVSSRVTGPEYVNFPTGSALTSVGLSFHTAVSRRAPVAGSTIQKSGSAGTNGDVRRSYAPG